MQYTAHAVACLTVLTRVVTAQTGYNEPTNSLMCPQSGGTYCNGESLTTPILINCVSTDVAEIHSCNLVLAHILPDGFEEAALCYQTSESAGDAVCAFNGTGYTLDGAWSEVPESAMTALKAANSSITVETSLPDSTVFHSSTDACEVFPMPSEMTTTISTSVTSHAGSSVPTGRSKTDGSNPESGVSSSNSTNTATVTSGKVTTTIPPHVNPNPETTSAHTIVTTEEAGDGHTPRLTTIWKTIVLFTETEEALEPTGVHPKDKDTTAISPPETGTIVPPSDFDGPHSSSESWAIVTISVFPTPAPFIPSSSSAPRPSSTSTTTTNAAASPRGLGEKGSNEARAAFVVLLVFAAVLL